MAPLVVYSVHYYGKGPYDYSCGFFYTISSIPKEEQKFMQDMSDGVHVAVFDSEAACFAQMRAHIAKGSASGFVPFCSPPEKLRRIVIGRHDDVPENDHGFRYSGPAERFDLVYRFEGTNNAPWILNKEESRDMQNNTFDPNPNVADANFATNIPMLGCWGTHYKFASDSNNEEQA